MVVKNLGLTNAFRDKLALRAKFIKFNIKRMASEIPTNLLIISNPHLINLHILYRCNLIMVDELKNMKL